MATTLTRYLKLKVADDLSADAKYNLNRLDTLGGISGATFSVDSTDNLNVRSRGDIVIEPQSPDVGGSNSGGLVQLGVTNHPVEVLLLTSSFKIDSALSLLSNTTGTAPNQIKRYLKLSPSGTLTADRNFTVDVTDENRSLTVPDDGTVVVIKGDGLLNLAGPLSIGQGGTGAITATLGTQNLLEVAAGSYIGNTNKILAINPAGTGLEWKAAGAGEVVSIQYVAPIYVDDGSNPGDTGSAATPIISLPEADGSTDGYLSATDWTTFNSKQAAGNYITSLTGVITASGPGAAATTLAATGVVPGTWNKATVTVNPDGRITNISSSPIVDADISATAAIAQSKVANLTSDLAGKEPTISAGTVGQYWTGAKSFADLTIAAVAGLQTALDGKYSTTNPANYIDAAGAATVIAAGKVAVYWMAGDGATKVITHNLGTLDVTVEIYDVSGATIYVDYVARTDTNTVTLMHSADPLAPRGFPWRVLIRS